MPDEELLRESLEGVDIDEEACLLNNEAREILSVAPNSTGSEVAVGELVVEVPLELAVRAAVVVAGYAAGLRKTGEVCWCTASSDCRRTPGSFRWCSNS